MGEWGGQVGKSKKGKSKCPCYMSMARSARLERVLNDGYAVCFAPGVVANWYAIGG
jgi:hypothetical protein